MEISCYRFLEGIIDYAGLYPPAQLPMEDAFRNFLKYKNDYDGFMIARFICPAQQLAEVSDVSTDALKKGESFVLSVTGRAYQTRAEFLEGLKTDISAINEFYARHPQQVEVEFYEAKFPTDLIENPDERRIGAFLNEAAEIFCRELKSSIRPFYEADFRGDWEARLTQIFNGYGYHQDFLSESKWGEKYQSAGFKLRCGGEKPEDYPTTRQVAFVLLQVLKNDIPMKATAGLHHPFYHFNREKEIYEHGFINLFGAGIIVNYLPFGEKSIEEILEEKEPANFNFDRDGFSWRALIVPSDVIRTIRKSQFISFGSCSFEEPLRDLRSLGYL